MTQIVGVESKSGVEMGMEGESAAKEAQRLRERAADLRAQADRLDSRAEAWERGADGERRVAAALQTVAGSQCMVLHDRLLKPGVSHSNLDHIVVCPSGNFLIDAKNWAGNVVEYESALWQHKWSEESKRTSIAMNAEVDKVRRMAGEMEAATTRVVEPVICLAGENADRFGEPRQIRGVWVVPLPKLTTWLLDRPRAARRTPIDDDAGRFDRAFPATSDPLARALVGTSWRARPAQSGRSTARRSAPARSARSKRAGGGVVAALASMIGLLVFAHLLPKIISGAAHAHGSVTPTGTAATSKWVEPCSGITDAVVARAVGRAVYKYQNAGQDTCLWGYQPRPNPYSPADISVATGWFAKNAWGKPGRTVDYRDEATVEGIWVPQLTRVPGSPVPASAVTQPILVEVLITGHYGAKISAAVAKASALQLAQAVARYMPTGPGATDVRYRY